MNFALNKKLARKPEMITMELTTYHYTDFSKVAIPALCVRVYLLGDEEGPELHVYSEERRRAANDD